MSTDELRDLAESVIETSGDGKLLRWAADRIEELEAVLSDALTMLETEDFYDPTTVISDGRRLLAREDSDNE